MSIMVSRLMPQEMVFELKKLSTTVLFCGKSVDISNETAYHPDMLFHKMMNGKFIAAYQSELLSEDIKAKIDNYVNLGSCYPNDCSLNCFRTEGELLCGKGVSDVIVDDAKNNGLEIVYVKQGYAACSTIKLECGAYIGSDVNIYNSLIKLGYDALLVSNDGILLNGFNCGFIGGTVLYTDKNTVAFSGKVSEHRDYNAIKDFCKFHNTKIIELSQKQLYDYGGFHHV